MLPEQLSKHRQVLAAITMAILVMAGMVAYSPKLYQIFCAVTGFGGTVNRATIQDVKSNDLAVAPTLKVHFDSNVAPGLDWTFKPEELIMPAKVGEPVKAYYYAKNNTDQTIVGRAVYNITPYKVAPYFFKIECFCFTEERLGPGEEARMPLVFYIDEQFMKEKDLQDVTDITLSYTFYRQKDLTEEEIEAARDLKRGSEALDASLAHDEVEFSNDAPRE